MGVTCLEFHVYHIEGAHVPQYTTQPTLYYLKLPLTMPSVTAGWPLLNDLYFKQFRLVHIFITHYYYLFSCMVLFLSTRIMLH